MIFYTKGDNSYGSKQQIVFQLFDVFSFIGYGFSTYFLFMFLLLAGFGVTGFALFTESWSYYSGSSMSFNLFFMLPALIQTLTIVAAVFAVAVSMIENLKQHEALVRKFWFVPVVGMIVAYVVAFFGWILDSIGIFGWWMAVRVFFSLQLHRC